VRIAVLLACHNRCRTTLSGLASLSRLMAALPEVLFSTILVDDGSTDGTAACVARDFGWVTILPGSGDLFWGGAMSLAAQRALADGADALLLLNDDVVIDVDAAAAGLRQAIANADGQRAVFVGATVSRPTGETTYSGFRRRYGWHPLSLRLLRPDGHLQPCDTFNGNFVLIPVAAYRKVGGLDPQFRHYGGDVDLGLRLTGAGVPAYVLPHPVGTCERGAPVAEVIRTMGLRQRWRYLRSPKNPILPAVRILRKTSKAWPILSVPTFVRLLRLLLHPGAGRMA